MTWKENLLVATLFSDPRQCNTSPGALSSIRQSSGGLREQTLRPALTCVHTGLLIWKALRAEAELLGAKPLGAQKPERKLYPGGPFPEGRPVGAESTTDGYILTH